MVGAAFVLVLLAALLAPLVIYWLVRAERGRYEEMDRESAEQVTRRDTGDRER